MGGGVFPNNVTKQREQRANQLSAAVTDTSSMPQSCHLREGRSQAAEEESALGDCHISHAEWEKSLGRER